MWSGYRITDVSPTKLSANPGAWPDPGSEPDPGGEGKLSLKNWAPSSVPAQDGPSATRELLGVLKAWGL